MHVGYSEIAALHDAHYEAECEKFPNFLSVQTRLTHRKAVKTVSACANDVTSPQIVISAHEQRSVCQMRLFYVRLKLTDRSSTECVRQLPAKYSTDENA